MSQEKEESTHLSSRICVGVTNYVPRFLFHIHMLGEQGWKRVHSTRARNQEWQESNMFDSFSPKRASIVLSQLSCSGGKALYRLSPPWFKPTKKCEQLLYSDICVLSRTLGRIYNRKKLSPHWTSRQLQHGNESDDVNAFKLWTASHLQRKKKARSEIVMVSASDHTSTFFLALTLWRELSDTYRNVICNKRKTPAYLRVSVNEQLCWLLPQ